MKSIKITIERSEDSFWAYATNEPLIVGGGPTIDACKQDVLDCIDTLRELNAKNKPDFLKDEYALVYQIDTQSFLEHYGKVFSRAALSRLTGINEKQLGHYIQGVHKPRKDKAEKIEKALHGLGRELLSLELL